MSKHILVTGGAGYIGSHTALEIISQGFQVTILDNLSNSSVVGLNALEDISGQEITFEKGDLLDRDFLENVFSKNSFDAIVHFAGLKAVGESVKEPLRYYRNNVEGTMNLLETAIRHDVLRLLFSSSATVYGQPRYLPIDERHPLQTTNPYGETKRVVEEILKSLSVSMKDFQSGILRYFNPIGAHETGRLGEDPKGVPNNLLPYIAQVAVGKLNRLSVWGSDYNTPDGTGVRDYIHVVDLAQAHLKALLKLFSDQDSFCVNLGTGNGYSVLEIIDAFEKASCKSIPYELAERRVGDVASCYADPTLAYNLLGWRAKYSIERMCKDHWRWQKQNPNGYE